MRFATLRDGTADGRAVLLSPDGQRCTPLPVKTLQELVERWEELTPALASLTDFPEILNSAALMAPLPRAWQWLDGSVYSSHGALMDKALGIEKPPVTWPLILGGVAIPLGVWLIAAHAL